MRSIVITSEAGGPVVSAHENPTDELWRLIDSQGREMVLGPLTAMMAFQILLLLMPTKE